MGVVQSHARRTQSCSRRASDTALKIVQAFAPRQVGYQHNNAYYAQFLEPLDCAPPSNFREPVVAKTVSKR